MLDIEKLCQSLKYISIKLVHFVIRIGGVKRGGLPLNIEKPFLPSFSGFMRSQLDGANSNSAMGFLEDFQIFIVSIHR